MTPKSFSIFSLFFIPFFLLAALFWALQPQVVYAATINVTTTVDENDGSCLDGDCSLRDAVATAVSGDTIAIPAGTYLLTMGEISTNKNLLLSGAGAASTTIDGNAASRLFQINIGGNITFAGLTLTNGNVAAGSGGAIVVNGATVVITNTVISSNTVSTNGGGIYITGAANVTLLSGQIMGNTAVAGGGVYINSTTSAFTQSGGEIHTNTASGAAAGAGVFVNQGSFTINSGQIRNNTATAAPGAVFPGGGIYVGTGTATLNGGEIRDNTAYRGGGVMINNATVNLVGTQILSNTATYGGGVYVRQSGATLNQSGGTIGYNTATTTTDFGGGGVYVFQGSLIVTGGQIRNNLSNHSGGGVNIASGTGTFNGGSLLDNTAVASGGAIHLRNSLANLTVENTTVSGNSPDAISVTDGIATVRGNTIENHTTAFQQVGGTLTTYANNISTFTTGVNSTGGTFNGRHNWWGVFTPTGVNHPDSFNYRLGAAVVEWGIGSLPDGAAVSGGTGTGGVVSHGTAVPFGIPGAPAGTPCSPFYDFFTAPGASGTWTVDVPVDASAGCDTTFNTTKLFHFALDGTNAPDTSCNPPTDCWLLYSSVTQVAGSPRKLQVNLTTAELGGTPIVTGDNNGDDPTAISLTALTGSQTNIAIWFIGIITAFLAGATAVLLSRRQDQ